MLCISLTFLILRVVKSISFDEKVVWRPRHKLSYWILWWYLLRASWIVVLHTHVTQSLGYSTYSWCLKPDVPDVVHNYSLTSTCSCFVKSINFITNGMACASHIAKNCGTILPVFSGYTMNEKSVIFWRCWISPQHSIILTLKEKDTFNISSVQVLWPPPPTLDFFYIHNVSKAPPILAVYPSIHKPSLAHPIKDFFLIFVHRKPGRWKNI